MKNFLNKNLIPLSIIIAGILIAGSLLFINRENLGGTATINPSVSPSPTATPTPEYKNLQDFAKCLTEKGVKFYGAWWCPHCQNQKAVFGDAVQHVDYVECEKTPDVSQGSITQACTDAKIEAFPTWIFPDGSQQLGELSLERLSELSGCPLVSK